MERSSIEIKGAHEHNLKDLDLSIPRRQITVVTGVSGSGKSSLAFDTVLAEANRRFFYTLSHYSRQFLDLGSRPALRSASGLSPAIALAQNETQPSVRATVASLSDIGEMLGVLFARFGEKRCPNHDLPTEARSLDEVLAHVRSQYFGRTLAVVVMIADQKKGQFKKPLEALAKKGYTKAWIDGEMLSLDPVPNLQKEEKHTVAVIIDALKVDPSKEARLRRSLETALQMGEALTAICVADAKGNLDMKSRQHISLQAGCPTCQFSWPKLDTRHFSPNSLGKCPSCDGRGVIIDEDEEDNEGDPEECVSCHGTGINALYKSILFRGRSIQRMYQGSLADLQTFTRESLDAVNEQQNAVRLVLQHVLSHADRMLEIGLGYLHLGRRVRTLSNGEAQRLRLSAILNEQLRGVLYVLDEPSQGLHPREIARLWVAIEGLKEQGNTVLIVDHDPEVMRRADWIIDLGPDGGRDGGNVLGQFAPKDAGLYAAMSLTAEHLHDYMRAAEEARPAVTRKSSGEFLTLEKPRLNNLKMAKARFPLEAMTVVSGVSGAGKSSLVLKTLFHSIERVLAGKKDAYHAAAIKGYEKLQNCTLISRKPIAKSSVSLPATYLDIFTDLRNLFASIPDAQIFGLSAASFSLSHDEGRCPECKGKGNLTLSMKFLADAEVACPTCQGKRYKPHLLDVRFHGLNMADVLNLSIAEAYERFQNFRAIERKLAPAVALGLGYLKLGQPSSSLSGGESQRLKLVPYLSKRVQPGTLLIMDEPTVGLHFRDVQKLLEQLRNLCDQGVTMIIIEHDQQVINAADWLLELGPESGDQGGELLYEGPPAQFSRTMQ